MPGPFKVGVDLLSDALNALRITEQTSVDVAPILTPTLPVADLSHLADPSIGDVPVCLIGGIAAAAGAGNRSGVELQPTHGAGLVVLGIHSNDQDYAVTLQAGSLLNVGPGPVDGITVFSQLPPTGVYLEGATTDVTTQPRWPKNQLLPGPLWVPSGKRLTVRSSSANIAFSYQILVQEFV